MVVRFDEDYDADLHPRLPESISVAHVCGGHGLDLAQLHLSCRAVGGVTERHAPGLPLACEPQTQHQTQFVVLLFDSIREGGLVQDDRRMAVGVLRQAQHIEQTRRERHHQIAPAFLN